MRTVPFLLLAQPHLLNNMSSSDLWAAVAAGDVDTVRALLLQQPGVDVDAYNADGATLTYIAAAHGHTALVELLVDEGGADIGKATRDDAKSLLVADWGGDPQPTQEELDAPFGGVCPLYIAARNGRAGVVRALIARGGDMNQTTKVDGRTLLIGAARGGHADVVKLLIENGGDVNQAANDGKSPVWVASQEGYTAVVKVLLENGGDIHQVDNLGATPVFVASEEGHTATLQLLLENGGVAKQADNDGYTPVYMASQNGHTAALKVLIQNGGDVNQASNEGFTPMFIASQNGHTAVLKVLLKHRADVHKPNSQGVAPVYIAAQKGHTDAVHLLLKAGASARTAEYKGQPTLHIAAANGHLPVVRVLAEIWPLDRRPWKMFLMGGGAASELQDYLAPPANRSTRNFLPRLYSKPDMVKEIWKYLHKPRYVDVGQLNGNGRTAAQVATAHGKDDVAALLQQLSLQ